MTTENTTIIVPGFRDVLPPEFARALDTICAAGISVKGSISSTINDEAGTPVTFFSYENLSINNEGVSVEKLAIDFKGVALYTKLIENMVIAILPDEVREALASDKGDTAAAA